MVSPAPRAPAGHGARVGALLPKWGTSSSSLQAGIWQLQVRATSASRKDPKKWRGFSQLGKEPTASSRKPPQAFQLGLLHSTGLCYKAVWEKEGINAPKAAVKSTLQSSCSLCYLILILIEIFLLVLPGVLGSLCTCCSRDRQAQAARTRCCPAARAEAAAEWASLPCQTFPLMPPLHLLNVSKLPTPSGILNIK